MNGARECVALCAALLARLRAPQAHDYTQCFLKQRHGMRSRMHRRTHGNRVHPAQHAIRQTGQAPPRTAQPYSNRSVTITTAAHRQLALRRQRIAPAQDLKPQVLADTPSTMHAHNSSYRTQWGFLEHASQQRSSRSSASVQRRPTAMLGAPPTAVQETGTAAGLPHG